MYDWIDIHFHKVSARILHFRFLSSSCSWHFCDFVCILPKFLDYTSLLLNKTVCLIWPKRCALKFHAEWWHYHAEIFIFRPCYDRKTFLGFCMFLTVVWMSVQVFLSGVVNLCEYTRSKANREAVPGSTNERALASIASTEGTEEVTDLQECSIQSRCSQCRP